MAEGKLYFAYGSNINLDQMAQRCPDAQVVGPVTLENYELLFRGNLRGAGVATIAPREGSTVHGLLWNITPECERSLDYYEGYPHLYGKEPVTVHGHDGQEHTVMAYVMTELCKEPSIPSFDYYNGILEGYRQNGLPFNRPLSDERGVPYDIVCGTFFLAGLGAEDFVSLTEEQIRRYKELYDNVMVITAVKEQPQGTKTEQKKKRGNAHER